MLQMDCMQQLHTGELEQTVQLTKFIRVNYFYYVKHVQLLLLLCVGVLKVKVQVLCSIQR